MFRHATSFYDDFLPSKMMICSQMFCLHSLQSVIPLKNTVFYFHCEGNPAKLDVLPFSSWFFQSEISVKDSGSFVSCYN